MNTKKNLNPEMVEHARMRALSHAALLAECEELAGAPVTRRVSRRLELDCVGFEVEKNGDTIDVHVASTGTDADAMAKAEREALERMHATLRMRSIAEKAAKEMGAVAVMPTASAHFEHSSAAPKGTQ